MVYHGHLSCNQWYFPLCLKYCKKSMSLINNSKDNCMFLQQIRSICIWLLLWLHYVFPFPMLMSVHPGTWGGSCIKSVTIFIERYKRHTDSLRAREQLFVLLIVRNKSCGSSNRLWLLCDIFPYSWEEKLFCVSRCKGGSGCGGLGRFICFWWWCFYPLNISNLKILQYGHHEWHCGHFCWLSILPVISCWPDHAVFTAMTFDRSYTLCHVGLSQLKEITLVAERWSHAGQNREQSLYDYDGPSFERCRLLLNCITAIIIQQSTEPVFMHHTLF